MICSDYMADVLMVSLFKKNGNSLKSISQIKTNFQAPAIMGIVGGADLHEYASRPLPMQVVPWNLELLSSTWLCWYYTVLVLKTETDLSAINVQVSQSTTLSWSQEGHGCSQVHWTVCQRVHSTKDKALLQGNSHYRHQWVHPERCEIYLPPLHWSYWHQHTPRCVQEVPNHRLL